MLKRDLDQARALRARGEGGFTLIELLVVVIIITVISAIAVPIYLGQRGKANDAKMEQDLSSISSLLTEAVSTKSPVTWSGSTISTSGNSDAGLRTITVDGVVTADFASGTVPEGGDCVTITRADTTSDSYCLPTVSASGGDEGGGGSGGGESGPVVSAPAAPGSLTAVAGSTQVTLEWLAPESNGATITDYVVQYRTNPEGEWATFEDGTSDALTVTVTGLANGTAYDFQVAATNSAGTGGYSNTATATPVAPATEPDAPTGLTATPGASQVTLNWTSPAGNGGAAITDYVVQYSTNAGFTSPVTANDGTSTNTSATITGLTPGTPYWFRVAAANSVGTGTASNVATATPFTTPGAPTGLTVTWLGGGVIKILWDAPSSNGGSALTGYVLQRSTDQSTWTNVFVSGTNKWQYETCCLPSQTRIYYRVAAVNVAGTGPWSATNSDIYNP